MLKINRGQVKLTGGVIGWDCSITNFAYFDGTSYVQCQESVRPGGSYPEGASPYGILEMAGNAWEWVDDWFQSGYYRESPLRNPPGPAEGNNKVLRGGAIGNTDYQLRVAYRGYANPQQLFNSVGFRCAAPAE